MAATNPAAEWFLRVGIHVHGPMSAAELRQKAAAGLIGPGARIRKGVDGQWVPAEKVQGLFPSSRRPPKAAAPPPEEKTARDVSPGSPEEQLQAELRPVPFESKASCKVQRPPIMWKAGRAVLSFLAGLLGLFLVLKSDYQAALLLLVYAAVFAFLLQSFRGKGTGSPVDRGANSPDRNGNPLPFGLLFAWGWTTGFGCLVVLSYFFVLVEGPSLLYSVLPLLLVLTPALLVAAGACWGSKSRVAAALIVAVVLVFLPFIVLGLEASSLLHAVLLATPLVLTPALLVAAGACWGSKSRVAAALIGAVVPVFLPFIVLGVEARSLLHTVLLLTPLVLIPALLVAAGASWGSKPRVAAALIGVVVLAFLFFFLTGVEARFLVDSVLQVVTWLLVLMPALLVAAAVRWTSRSRVATALIGVVVLGVVVLTEALMIVKLEKTPMVQGSEYDNAIAGWTEAIRLNPKDAEAYYRRGVAYSAQGEKSKAEADFAEAKRLGYKPQ